MHKKVRYIIAASLVVGSVCGALPANNFVFGPTEAYASTYKGASDGELSSLTIKRGSGSEVTLRDSYAGDEISLTSKSDYYIELNGSEGLEVSADVKGNGYVVKEFTSAGKTEKGKDVGDFIKMDSTYEDIYLRTYKSEDAYKEASDKEDVTDCEKTYMIHVKRPVAISDEEEDAEYAYLRSIYLSDGNIDFSKKETSYNVNVKDNVEEILVRATPEDDDYLVSINDSSVDKDKNYEKTVKLNKGNNTIKIEVESNDDKKTYTLNIYRGNTSATTSNNQGTQSTASSTQNISTQDNIGKFNSWQKIDGKWKYINGTGQPLKSMWWFDVNTGKSYYLKEDGSMATGWVPDNNSWYYCNESGARQTGWICLSDNWYYLNKAGVMQTGWFENSDGKWYYLDSTGKMVKNLEVGGYKLGDDGALIN